MTKTRFINTLFLLMTCLLVACYSGKPLTSHTEKTVSDTVTIERQIVERDTLIVIQKDSSTLDIDFDLLLKEIAELKSENKSVYKKFQSSSERSKVQLQLQNNRLTATCECTEEEYIIQLQDQLISELRERKTVITETKEVAVKYVPPITKTMSIVGGTAVAMIVSFSGFKLFKIFRPI